LSEKGKQILSWGTNSDRIMPTGPMGQRHLSTVPKIKQDNTPGVCIAVFATFSHFKEKLKEERAEKSLQNTSHIYCCRQLKNCLDCLSQSSEHF
jgi:hypothetical protein